MAFDSIPGIIDAIRFRLVAYEDTIGRGVHLALVKDAPYADAPVLVRLHIENTLCNVPQALGPIVIAPASRPAAHHQGELVAWRCCCAFRLRPVSSSNSSKACKGPSARRRTSGLRISAP